jgi:hypothetical protein
MDQGSRHQDRFDRRGRKAHWTQVEVHRHPVVNEDGSNTVYKVKVRGAEITVTRAKGLLKRINNKIVHATG